jgi:hypothetical protein
MATPMETAMTHDAQATRLAAAAPGLPAVADRAAFQAELDRLRAREKAHTREGDAIAAAGRPIAQWPRLEAGRSDDLGAKR